MLPPRLESLRQRMVATLQRTAAHDDIYDHNYYSRDVEPTMAVSAGVMAESIHRDLAPARVIDVGCGTGALLAALTERGIVGQGFDYSTAALEWCRRRGLSAARLDLEHDPIPAVRADVVISTEVAEHLPARCADRYVEHLVTMAPVVVMTAAEPGAGGTDHVNEQPLAYWIQKFHARGYVYDAATACSWRAEWERSGVAACFARAVMIFRRSTAPADPT